MLLYSMTLSKETFRMKTPINSRTLKQHFAYNWWKYLLVAVLAFGLVDLLYSVTAYRSPAEKKIEFYVYGQMDQEKLTAYMEGVRAAEMEDMEVMAPLQLIDDGYYGSMQLMTYMAVGEGDVYLLPRDQFVSGASGGSFLPLENDTELMALFDNAGINLQNGWRKHTETGRTISTAFRRTSSPVSVNMLPRRTAISVLS